MSEKFSRMHDEAAIVVLAATEAAAIAYGKRVRGSSWWKIIPLTQRADLYLLYGHNAVPFDVVPGTPIQEWHSQLQRHIEYNRIVPRRTLSQRLPVPDPAEPEAVQEVSNDVAHAE